MQTRNLTDEEVLELGYQALVDKLGPAGFVRFVRLHGTPAGDYAEIRERMLTGMTVGDIYDRAARLEAEREKRRDAGR